MLRTILEPPRAWKDKEELLPSKDILGGDVSSLKGSSTDGVMTLLCSIVSLSGFFDFIRFHARCKAIDIESSNTKRIGAGHSNEDHILCAIGIEFQIPFTILIPCGLAMPDTRQQSALLSVRKELEKNYATACNSGHTGSVIE